MLKVLSSRKEPRLVSSQITQKSNLYLERNPLCIFTFANRRHCRTPRAATHPACPDERRERSEGPAVCHHTLDQSRPEHVNQEINYDVE